MTDTNANQIDSRMRLADREEIREVLARYFRGVDRRDWDLVRSCYHDDATDEHGSLFQGKAADFIDWVSVWIAETFAVTMHIGGQSLIDLDGEAANVETYAIAMHRTSADETGGQVDLTVAARLVDRFERRAGRWRIAHRRLIDDWVRLDAVNNEISLSTILGDRNH